MKDNNVSGRYAQALYLLTQKHAAKDGQPLVPVLERTLEDLKGLAELVQPGSKAGAFLTNPQVSPAEKRRVLELGLKGRAMRTVEVFGDLLLRKKRLNLTAQIARDFETLVERAQGLQRAQVVSAVPLTQPELDRLHGELERTTGKKITITTLVDPTLLGGAYVRIGDRIVDRSVTTLLQAIAHKLFEVSV
ncbi:MAG: ATP synthase F1 subunit delta [Candidatus Eisenbacteria bacterium]|nr:ATP synthase F1 subunit delta [Candidatus Eisenbacteria bacterium]